MVSFFKFSLLGGGLAGRSLLFPQNIEAGIHLSELKHVPVIGQQYSEDLRG